MINYKKSLNTSDIRKEEPQEDIWIYASHKNNCRAKCSRV